MATTTTIITISPDVRDRPSYTDLGDKGPGAGNYQLALNDHTALAWWDHSHAVQWATDLLNELALVDPDREPTTPREARYDEVGA